MSQRETIKFLQRLIDLVEDNKIDVSLHGSRSGIKDRQIYDATIRWEFMSKTDLDFMAELIEECERK